MNYRTLDQLLELMLENQILFRSGLCHWAMRLYEEHIISENELWWLEDYIEDNKPSFIFRWCYGGFYWKPGRIRPRIEWIKKHIKKIKSKQNEK